MPLPIAIGGKATSSIPFRIPPPLEHDGEPHLKPRSIPHTKPLVVVCQSTTASWEATVAIHYHDMIENSSKRHRTVASVVIQIVPLGEAYSSTYPDRVHRIELPSSGTEDQLLHEQEDTSTSAAKPTFPIQPSAVWSTNDRYISLVIPYPYTQQSILVVLQLRRPLALLLLKA